MKTTGAISLSTLVILNMSGGVTANSEQITRQTMVYLDELTGGGGAGLKFEEGRRVYGWCGEGRWKEIEYGFYTELSSGVRAIN